MAESVLVLPVLLFLVFGLLQLGWVLWLRIQLQYAAQAAARAYTAWEPLDRDAALDHARQAAWMCMHPGPLGLRMELQAQPGEIQRAGFLDWGGQDQPGVHQLQLQAHFWMPGPLGKQWDLRASSAILGVIPMDDCCADD